MRCFAVNEPDDNGNPTTIVISEEMIRELYYPYWLKRMQIKFGPDNTYSFEDCLDEWIVVNWAIPITEET